MPIAHNYCREALSAPVPNEAIVALLYQSLPKIYGIVRLGTPLPPELALNAIKNDGVDAAVLCAYSATDPEVLARLMRDSRTSVKEALATVDTLLPEHYQRLWGFAYETQRSEMLVHLAPRIDLAWVLAQNLGGNWTGLRVWDIIAERVIETGDRALLLAASAQARPQLAARVLALVASRDLTEFAELLATLNPADDTLGTFLRADFCPNSCAALLTIAHRGPEFKDGEGLKAVIRGWCTIANAANFVDAIMSLIKDGTLSVEDIPKTVYRNPDAWAAINAYITSVLGENPRNWATFLRLADIRGDASLPDTLAEALA